jgi:signal transduction histidine kinase
MANLLMLRGPGAGKRFSLDGRETVIGRQAGLGIHLDLPDVSRRHARITREDERLFLEDLGSSNGTLVDGQRISGKVALDGPRRITIGPCEFLFETPQASDEQVEIRAELPSGRTNFDLYRQDSASKLRAVLDIAHQLAQSRDLDELWPRLLDHLLGLFPKADRGLVLLRDRERMVVRAVKARRPERGSAGLYSRSVVQRVVSEGIGIMAANRGTAGETLQAAGILSFVCVPLKSRDGRVLGVLQLDRAGRGDTDFGPEDLHLLTAISLQVSAVLENTALHAELLEHERVKRDLALARLGQMAAGVAHEISNPLAFVSNNTFVVQRDLEALRKLLDLYERAARDLAPHRPELVEEIQTFISEIDLPYTLRSVDDLLVRSRDGLKRIQQIVQGLRDFARLDERAQNEADINEGIEATATIARGLAEKRQVSLVLELTPLPRIACQPAQINQVVFNLVVNGIDACAAGGRVTVRTAIVPGTVEIHVVDNGHGIDPAIRDKIFDPFFTTKPLGKGVGLGLSISHGIVQHHRGRIDFESAPGQGAHFVVRLPCATPS